MYYTIGIACSEFAKGFRVINVAGFRGGEEVEVGQ
jgi:hypothetical protein